MSSSESDSRGGKAKSIDGRVVATSVLNGNIGAGSSGGGAGNSLSIGMQLDLSGMGVGDADCSACWEVALSSVWVTLLPVL